MIVDSEKIRGIMGERLEEDFELIFKTGEKFKEEKKEEIDKEKILSIFIENCSFCHNSDEPTENIILDSPQNILDTTVNKPSSQWYQWLIIKSEDAGRSYLMYKLLGVHGIYGYKMPIGGSLSKEEIKLIERWIIEGASF